MSQSQFRWLLVMPSSVWPYALETVKFYIYIYMDERQAGKWKAEAAPFRSRPQAGWNRSGWGSRGRASGGAIAPARAGGRGDAVRWFRVRGRWSPHAASCALSLGRRGLASGVGRWRGDGVSEDSQPQRAVRRNEVDPADFLEPSRGRGGTLALSS